jgi:hypothetical protein
MKNRTIPTIVATLFTAALILSGNAAWAKDKGADSSVIEMRKRVEEKEKELNGSKWSVAVSSTNPKIKPYTDQLIFQDGQVKMESLLKRGFGPTNYTVTSPEGSENTTWESMQTGKDGVVFLRGVWSKEVMEGAINEQLEEGKDVRDLYFNSTGKLAIPTSSKQEEKKAASSTDTEKEAATQPAKALKSMEKK